MAKKKKKKKTGASSSNYVGQKSGVAGSLRPVSIEKTEDTAGDGAKASKAPPPAYSRTFDNIPETDKQSTHSDDRVDSMNDDIIKNEHDQVDLELTNDHVENIEQTKSQDIAQAEQVAYDTCDTEQNESILSGMESDMEEIADELTAVPPSDMEGLLVEPMQADNVEPSNKTTSDSFEDLIADTLPDDDEHIDAPSDFDEDGDVIPLIKADDRQSSRKPQNSKNTPRSEPRKESKKDPKNDTRRDNINRPRSNNTARTFLVGLVTWIIIGVLLYSGGAMLLRAVVEQRDNTVENPPEVPAVPTPVVEPEDIVYDELKPGDQIYTGPISTLVTIDFPDFDDIEDVSEDNIINFGIWQVLKDPRYAEGLTYSEDRVYVSADFVEQAVSMELGYNEPITHMSVSLYGDFQFDALTNSYTSLSLGIEFGTLPVVKSVGASETMITLVVDTYPITQYSPENVSDQDITNTITFIMDKTTEVPTILSMERK